MLESIIIHLIVIECKMSFVLHGNKNVMQIWNDMEMSKLWQMYLLAIAGFHIWSAGAT